VQQFDIALLDALLRAEGGLGPALVRPGGAQGLVGAVLATQEGAPRRAQSTAQKAESSFFSSKAAMVGSSQ